MAKKVAVGMSGGVDSSVAAYLLKEQGYDVIGVTMQIWQDLDEKYLQENAGHTGIAAVDDARKVADDLGIPHYVMSFKNTFDKHVVCNFIEEYLSGRTPNPCIVCNRMVKWQALLTRAAELGVDYVATGHYARIIKNDKGRYTLKTSAFADKDQTYALYRLTQEQLEKTLMPVGEYSKDEVRAVAEKIGLEIASKPDSQDICFVPDGDYAGFIERNVEADRIPPKGNFVTTEGDVIGEHKGIMHYTIGQRKGLGIALGHPAFVTEIRPETNEVVIGTNADVFKTELYADQVNWMSIDGLHGQPIKAKGKVRYSGKVQSCTVEEAGEDRIKVTFDEPTRAVTPGQAVVFYDEDDCILGGGTIC